ncbi:MAG: hypothetical protein ABR958_01905 [Dehalococcoidales bacterium]
MDTIAKHLVQALCSLTKVEKVEVVNLVLKDVEFREVLSELPIKKLIGSENNQEIRNILTTDNDSVSIGTGKKARGKKLRKSYISELQQKGILIEPFNNVWAETSTGLWVAIPTATMEGRPGRWFLGLSEDKVREKIGKGGVVIILLCQTASGLRLDFVLPPEIVEEIVGKLSKSKGELKFNVWQVGNHYTLVIPENNNIDVSDFKGNISILPSGT